jgi:1,4-alpha-glucan branching enzyme
VRLVLRAPDARVVEVAGDWTDWRPVPAARARDGRWWVDVRLARGDYRYAFRVDRSRWRVPDDVQTVDDGFGGRSAVLVVR